MKVKFDFFPLNFKFMEMVECKASLKTHCPRDCLKTKTKTTREKQSTNSLKNLPCHKWRHLTSDYHSNLFDVTKHNGRSKL